MDGGSTPVITTATSQSDGRLIVGAGRPTRGIPLAGSSSSLRNKKRKYLKDIVSKNKKDGKGGLGMTTNAPNSPLDNSGAALPPTSQSSLTPQNNVISTANPRPARKNASLSLDITLTSIRYGLFDQAPRIFLSFFV